LGMFGISSNILPEVKTMRLKGGDFKCWSTIEWVTKESVKVWW
jgi:hypothetical protein